MRMEKILVISSLVVLAACNGGGGGGSGGGGSVKPGAEYSIVTGHLPTSVGTVNGVLVDSAIIGMNYTSGASSGVTGAGGSFICQAGSVITFKIGDIVVGKSPCLPVITPIELTTLGALKAHQVSFTSGSVNELSESQNNRLKRISMFLQTLDSDGNLSNGISLAAGAEVILRQILTASDSSTLDESFNEGSITSEYTDALSEYINNTGSPGSVPSALGSIAHLSSTIGSMNLCVNSDVLNSASVAGYSPNCVALSCIDGYSIINGACVSDSITSFAQVMEVYDNYVVTFNADFDFEHGSGNGTFLKQKADGSPFLPLQPISEFMESVVGFSSHGANICNPSSTTPYASATGQNLSGFYLTTTYNALLNDILSDVKGRATNGFLTTPGSGYIAGRRCAEKIANDIVKYGILSNEQKTELLGLVNVTNDQNFVVSLDGSGLSADELAILDLIVTYYNIQ